MRYLWLAATVLCACSAVAAEPEKEEEKPKFREHEVRNVEGWNVHVDKKLLEGEYAELGTWALRVLSNQLFDISHRVPDDRVAKLREVPIYLDHDHPLRGMQYHPNVGWLRDNGHDPAMEKCVHIPESRRLIEHIRRYAQPSVVLHELAHAYHDRVLSFDEEEIRAAYKRAKEAKLYESVLHMRGTPQKHYALTDHKEFFAEMTESFLGTNDFYPFVRGELKECDEATFKLLEKIWLEKKDR